MSLQPEQALGLLQMFLPTLRMEHTTTLRVIEAIPVDKGDYRPDAISMTALELAWHIVATERRFLMAIAAGEFDLSPFPRPEKIATSAELSKWYAESFAENVAKLEKITGEPAAKIIDFRGFLQLPAVAFLQFSMGHAIHHRGQLSMYLRPMGAKVPAIYGESYDSKQAKQAGA